MAGGGRRDDRERFEREMADVKPLATGKARVATPKRRPTARPADQSPDVAFLREGEGDEVGFYAKDLGRDPLLRLLRGEVEMTFAVDLHHRNAKEARRDVAQALAQAMASGARGLRIVHGKGLHSLGPAVVRDIVREGLLRPPLARWVAALAPAPARQGGTGVTLVCLRRARASA